MDDVRAVMDAVGSERAALFGVLGGRADVDPLRRHVPGANARPRPLQHVREAAVSHDIDEEQRAAIIDRGRQQLGRRDERSFASPLTPTT